MEIRDYLRAIRRILPLLIILPIVAAVITGFFLEKQPSKYQANATVVVPAISGNGTSQSAASQYVDTFKDVLVSQPVVADVHQKFSDISIPSLVAGLTADTVTASSNIIHVTLVAPHSPNLPAAVREATVATMDAIAQPGLIQAENEVSQAQTLLQKANGQINDFVAQYGNPSPSAYYNVQSTRLSQLESTLVTATINNDVKLIPSIKSSIAAQTQKVTQAGQQLDIYVPLSNAQSAAIAANDHAQSQLVAAQPRAESAGCGAGAGCDRSQPNDRIGRRHRPSLQAERRHQVRRDRVRARAADDARSHPHPRADAVGPSPGRRGCGSRAGIIRMAGGTARFVAGHAHHHDRARRTGSH
jgi:capsular polysaccharide biosynthesis protein